MRVDREVKVQHRSGPIVEYGLCTRVILVRKRTFDGEDIVADDTAFGQHEGFIIGNFPDEQTVIEFLEFNGNTIVEDSNETT